MPTRSELPIEGARAFSARKQQGFESKYFVIGLAVAVVLLAAIAVIVGLPPTDTIPIEAQSLVGP